MGIWNAHTSIGNIIGSIIPAAVITNGWSVIVIWSTQHFYLSYPFLFFPFVEFYFIFISVCLIAELFLCLYSAPGIIYFVRLKMLIMMSITQLCIFLNLPTLWQGMVVHCPRVHHCISRNSCFFDPCGMYVLWLSASVWQVLSFM